MKVDFVLAAFCLILVNANPSANQDANQDANPLVKESDEISCPTKDFSCGKFVSVLVLTVHVYLAIHSQQQF